LKGHLLDTQALLFWRSGEGPVGRSARRVLRSEEATLHFSVASIWEISIKRSIGKLEMDVATRDFIDTAVAAGVRLLEIRPAHLYRLEALPWHHRDPFDRLLAAQALEEDLAVIGKDAVFERYGLRRVW
jgi:PIN domain nuclease of toxin-antitoxin system